jgi:ribosomal protein L25 (general stress protein Ctc)
MMMTTATETPTKLEAQERDTARNPRQLRAAGLIPATIYGKGFGPLSIQVPTKPFYMAYRDGADMYELAGIGVIAKAHQVQVHSMSHEILHIEFLFEAKQ